MNAMQRIIYKDQQLPCWSTAGNEIARAHFGFGGLDHPPRDRRSDQHFEAIPTDSACLDIVFPIFAHTGNSTPLAGSVKSP
jgi:hypothetical protein